MHVDCPAITQPAPRSWASAWSPQQLAAISELTADVSVGDDDVEHIQRMVALRKLRTKSMLADIPFTCVRRPA
jgi:hypothetical protein